MSDIFISYAREDRPYAEKLAHALETQGWSVWWDLTIPAGRTFDEVIERALGDAKCVIALWSAKSVASRWVRTEAEEGAARRILVPILIDEAQVPLAFRRIQAANLIGWDGTETAASFQRLVGDIAALLGSPPSEREEKRRVDAEAKHKAEEEENQKRRRVDAESMRRAAEEESRLRAEAEVKRRAGEDEEIRPAEVQVPGERAEPVAQARPAFAEPERLASPPVGDALPVDILRSRTRRRLAWGVGATGVLIAIVVLWPEPSPGPRPLQVSPPETALPPVSQPPLVAHGNSSRDAPAGASGDITSRPNLKVSPSGETVLDGRTNLMWTRGDFRMLEGRFVKDWYEAMGWAELMNRRRYAGFQDWRVPTIVEYRTINRSASDRVLYARIFDDGGAYAFWASNSLSRSVASYISFKEGFAVSGDKSDKPFPFSVRLVRSASIARD